MGREHGDRPITLANIEELMRKIDEALDGLEGITEREWTAGANKNLSAHRAVINRKLLFAQHLAKTLELEIMTQYHIFRGEEPPEIIPTPNGG